MISDSPAAVAVPSVPADGALSPNGSLDVGSGSNNKDDDKPQKVVGLSPAMIPVMKKAFANLCHQPAGVLFENKYFKVGIKHEYKGSTDGRMAVFFQTNKDARPLNHFKVVVDKVASLRTELIPTPPELLFDGDSDNSGTTLVPGMQAKLLLFVELVSKFEKSPLMKVMFQTQEGEAHEYPLLLPIVATAFKPVEETKQEDTQEGPPSSSTEKEEDPAEPKVGTGPTPPTSVSSSSAETVEENSSRPKAEGGNAKSKTGLASFLGRGTPRASNTMRGSATVAGSTPATAKENIRTEQPVDNKAEIITVTKSMSSKKQMFESMGKSASRRDHFKRSVSTGRVLQRAETDPAASSRPDVTPARRRFERTPSWKAAETKPSSSSSSSRPYTSPMRRRFDNVQSARANLAPPSKEETTSSSESKPDETPSRRRFEKAQSTRANLAAPPSPVRSQSPSKVAALRKTMEETAGTSSSNPVAVPPRRRFEKAQSTRANLTAPPSPTRVSFNKNPPRRALTDPASPTSRISALPSQKRPSFRVKKPPASPSKSNKPERRSFLRRAASSQHVITSGPNIPGPPLSGSKAGGTNTPNSSSRRNLFARSVSSNFGVSFRRKNKPAEPPAAPKVDVPKVVKSLQSGCVVDPQNVPGVLKECKEAIRNNPDVQLELGQTEAAIPSVVKIMNRGEDDPQVQEISCSIISDLCEAHDQNRECVVNNDGLKAILVALLKHEKTLAVQVSGLSALANLGLNENNQVAIADMGGLEVLKTCVDHYEDCDVQAQACRVIASLARNERNSKAITGMRLGKNLLIIAEANPWNETFQQHYCGAVRSLTAEVDTGRGSLASAGVVGIIIAAMRKFEANAALQASACGALGNLTIKQAQVVDSIVNDHNGDGVRSILTAMRKHKLDPHVQEAGCGAMKSLTDNEEHAKIIGEKAITPILDAMRQHENIKAVTMQGCSALCNLAMIHEYEAPIRNAGGIGMIVFSMKQLEDSAEVQKQACRAFRNLAADDQNKVSIAASGGITAMLVAMDKHEKNCALQVFALRALDILVQVNRNRTLILNHDGVRIIGQAMANHPRDQFVEKVGGALLETLGEG